MRWKVGKRNIYICINADKPDKPQGPLEATETTPNAITVQWKPPKDTGGLPLDHYVLEKRLKGSNKWTKCPGHIDPNETEATAKNLDEGQEYDFRVMAVNKEGESEPLVTSAPIKAKYPFGECIVVIWTRQLWAVEPMSQDEGHGAPGC